MTTIVAQIAPQRSTQYGALASTLAPYELQLSRLCNPTAGVDTLEMGGQPYLKFEMAAGPDENQARELGMLATVSAFFFYYERLGEHTGPLLRPIETRFEPQFAPEIVMTRRYKGKTNEMFTHFLCNVARFSSDFAHRPWQNLRVFDPLTGGGTTLFTALVLGAEVAGVEKNAQNVQTTAAFLRQYAREQGIACKVKEERLKKLGERWWFTVGKEPPRQFVIAKGETAQSADLISGFKKPHLIVTDLPYGIQHHSALIALLAEALPVWASLLMPGGVMAFAWDSTRLARPEMIEVVAQESRLSVIDAPPYNALAHRVDRVIKQRDIIVARRV
ncbi:MAG: hypothetical protein JXB47_14690 [Anaerolineae bacterium]|nr:hypothetical protein [Anaerolineae bacterium]